METRTYQVYKFEELPEASQKLALEKNSDINTDYYWHEPIIQEWRDKLVTLGFANSFDQIEISYSGFWSQGDGASFTSKNLDLVKWIKQAGKVAAKKYAPLIPDIEAMEITGSVERIDRHYSHWNTCRVSIDSSSGGLPDETIKLMGELEAEMEKHRIELSREIYRDLENNYTELTSDDCIKQQLIEGEYNFTLDGKIDYSENQ